MSSVTARCSIGIGWLPDDATPQVFDEDARSLLFLQAEVFP